MNGLPIQNSIQLKEVKRKKMFHGNARRFVTT